MSRMVAGLGLVFVVAGAPAGAYAADWESFGTRFSHDLRGAMHGYDDFEPLGFELGARYWHSLGFTTTEIGGGEFAAADQAHIIEGHFRIDDYSTGWFLKGLGGYAFAISGEYNDGGYIGEIVDGRIGYAGADLAFAPWGDLAGGSGIGFLGGYQYWHDNPDVGRGTFAVVESADDITWSDMTGEWSVGFDSEPNSIDIHALRLGLAGRVDLGMLDFTAEVAAVPYAWVGGTMGAHGDYGVPLPPYPGCGAPPPAGCDAVTGRSSATSIEGAAYGAMAEGFLGFNPTENLTIRVGGRAWYLQGTYDAVWTETTVTPPQRRPQNDDGSDPNPLFGAPIVTTQNFIETDNPFSLLRVGGLIELTGRF